MIDIQKIKYKLILVTETGEQIDGSGAAQDLGWEEGEKELALRLGFSLNNAKHNGNYLSSIVKPGCVAIVVADWSTAAAEVARGVITDWDPEVTGSDDIVSYVAYDELFPLQGSQDNRYISSGTGTKAALMALFNEWKIPVKEYRGPDVRHAKTLFKNDYVSDIVLDLLGAAVKQGAAKHIIRASHGAVSVLPVGSNDDVYHFEENTNLSVSRDKISTQDMITRVKVVAKEDDDGRQAVEAIVDGQTKFGIRQRIYNRSEDDSFASAKTAAQKIIDEDGSPERTITIESPDVPLIRKGDKIHITARYADGFFIVKSIMHDATNCTMKATIEPMETQNSSSSQTSRTETFEKGDRIILNGAVYRDSYGNGKGRTFNGYSGKITIKVEVSRACPYHVDGIGWVYPNSIKKA